MMYSWYGWWGFFPSILWILFWIFIIFLFWKERKYPHSDNYSNEKTAEEILSERFARGEINEKEYEHRLEVIRKHAKGKRVERV